MPDLKVGGASLIDSAKSSVNTVIAAGYCDGLTKRVLDLVLGFIGLMVLAVIFIPVGITIKLTSKGPILFRQERLGLGGIDFTAIKFRTMYTNAEQGGKAVWAEIDDPRLTVAGGLLRRLYIDEFPQFWNVIRGDMSIVGPRPERTQIVEMLAKNSVDYSVRTSIKPGVTGIAQVLKGYASDVRAARNKARLDLVYITNASLWFDLKIIFGTLSRIVKMKGR